MITERVYTSIARVQANSRKAFLIQASVISRHYCLNCVVAMIQSVSIYTALCDMMFTGSCPEGNLPRIFIWDLSFSMFVFRPTPFRDFMLPITKGKNLISGCLLKIMVLNTPSQSSAKRRRSEIMPC